MWDQQEVLFLQCFRGASIYREGLEIGEMDSFVETTVLSETETLLTPYPPLTSALLTNHIVHLCYKKHLCS